MTQYRLLRDNKESGPYTEEEMIAKGFKPYDLLWADGKSAGWQYPSEINVFKKYAPIVEEQPFDRFYKKQPPQKSPLEERAALHALRKSTPREYTPVPAPEPAPAPRFMETYATPGPERHIHVTLPSGRTVNFNREATRPAAASTVAGNTTNNNNLSNNNFAVSTPASAKPETQKPASPTILAQPKAFDEFAGGQPVSAAAPIAVQKENLRAGISADEPYRSRSSITNMAPAGFSWTMMLGGVLGIATLVGLGVMIGLSINKQKTETAFNDNFRKKTVAVIPVPEPQKPVETATFTPVPVVATPPTQKSTVAARPAHELVQNAVVKNGQPEGNHLRDDKDDKKTAQLQTALPANQTSTVNREDDNAARLKAATPVVMNIEKSLLLNQSSFKSGAFGGISNLKYTLTNSSRVALENVEVEIDYIQANNKVYKTEKLFFKDIPAGGQLTLDAPSSSRGVKVSGRILKVNSKDAITSNATVHS